MMSGIGGKNTKPELVVRKALHRMGFRYRLHVTGLPGKPDMVFSKYSAIILINGCFWHKHNCHLFKWPATHKGFWRKKILATNVRDKRNLVIYVDMGWRVLIIWECAIKGKTRLPLAKVVNDVANWLKSGEKHYEIKGAVTCH